MDQNNVNSLSQFNKEEQNFSSLVPLTEFKELLQKHSELDYEIIEKQCNVISKYNEEEQYKEFALLCQSKGHINPDWLLLAGQIRIKYIKNTVPKNFSDSTVALRCILRDDYYNFVIENAKRLNSMVQEEKDYKFNLFAVETLLKSYLARIKKDAGTTIFETPQYMYMRVATFLWFNKNNVENSLLNIEKMYQDLSNGRYSMASPTMFNSGLFRSQLASCFAAGTQVFTINKGHVAIEDVELGDEVVTHLGNVKKVTQLHKNPLNNRQMYKMKVTKSPEVCVTGNHRFWAIQKLGDGKPRWTPVEHLWPGDFIAVPPRNQSSKPFDIDITEEKSAIFSDKFEYKIKDQMVYPTTVWESPDHLNGTDSIITRHKKNSPINKNWIADSDWGFFVGAWYGDGNIITSTYKEKISVRGIRFVADKRNEKIIEKISDIGTRKTGIQAKINPGSGKNKNIVYIDFHSNVLGEYFVRNYGKGFQGKILDRRMNGWGGKEIYGFMCGLFSSDGCWTKDNMLVIQLSNPKFMKSLYHLLRSQGLEVNYVWISKTRRRGVTSDMVTMQLPTGYFDPEDVCKYYEDDRLNTNYKPTINSFTKEFNNQRFIRLQNKMEIDDKPEFVYTLGVEDDHSYCVEGLVAENCFLYNLGDSMQSISKGWHDAAIISMNSGGLGIDFSSLRHSEIGQHGQTNGIVPWIKIMDQILLTVDQGSKRKGSGTAYLCCWHLDVEEFLDLRKASGPENMRARDMFYALWISDEFMRRVEKDEDWTLFCPNKAPKLDEKWGLDFEIAYRGFEKKTKNGKLSHFRVVKARELWKKIILTQIETGMPFILYKDAINRKSNQKNLGTTRLSNLCVHGDTCILTDQGQIPIQDLENQNVNVWNGKEWSKTIVRKTGENKNLLKVTLSNGVEIDCTPEHDFYVKSSYHSKPTKVKAKDLVEDAKLIKYSLPNAIEFENTDEFVSSYTHGFFCGDGTYTSHKNKKPMVSLYGEKRELLKYLDYTSYGSLDYEKINVILNNNIRPKFDVPHNSSIEDRLEWFSGYADADGTIAKNGNNESLQIGCIHKNFLLEVRLMLQTLGVDSKVTIMRNEERRLLPDGKGSKKLYDCKTVYRLLVNSNDLWLLQNIGFNCKRLKINNKKPQRSASNFIKVVKVEDGLENVDTFCFTENKRNMGMFGGVLLGNCTEITLYTDKDNVASCNLGSIVLNSCVKFNEGGKSYFDFDELERLTREMTKNINQMIDRNYYPVEIPQIKYANLRNRPIGIGVQGLADTFAMLDLAWSDEKARQLNEMIFETMYYSAISESVDLAKKFGSYETFQGSPASEGLFQFDLWDSEKLQKDFEGETKNKPFITSEFLNDHIAQRRGPITNRYNWNELRKEMTEYGMRNSMLMALMPTASSASILGNHESFEPYTQHFYARTVLSGQYIIINKHLVSDLQKINMWKTDTLRNIMQNGGSITNLSEDGLGKETLERLKFLKKKYLTVFEIPQKVLVDMALDRGRYVCQTQSFNCWMSEPTFARLNKFHFYGWKGGAKTGMYYLRQTARTDPTNFSIGEMNIPTKRQLIKSSKFECNDEVCVACSS